MEALKKKILEEGAAVGTEIVKVDNFLNHQVDVRFMDEIGKEFRRRFGPLEPTRILTVESSGIIVAAAVSKYYGYAPVVFAKKAAPNTMTEGFYSTPVRSFTKGLVSLVRVAHRYLGLEDRVLIIDDFLAHGEAAIGLLDLAEQAGARVLGVGAVIEKAFQGGGQRLRAKGIEPVSLAVVESIRDGVITFR